MRPALLIQYLLPQHLLSRLVFLATRWRFEPWKNFLIRQVSRRYAVDLDEAAESSEQAWPHFNAFFTRALQPGARPQPSNPAAIACPADGRLSQAGAIRAGRILQAKGRDYSVAELLADEAAAADYAQGSFATVYLSPRDYHRVHMPLDGELVETLHVPGRLFTVAPFAVESIPRLFARNERLVCRFQGSQGPFAVVLVGALLVSGIETVWRGVEVPPYARAIVRRNWRARGIRLQRGDELGRFNMGSTVILLLSDAVGRIETAHRSADPLRVGEAIGHLSNSRLEVTKGTSEHARHAREGGHPATSSP